MASFCVRPNGFLQYDLCLYGRRFRESSGLRDTPENRRRVRKDEHYAPFVANALRGDGSAFEAMMDAQQPDDV